MNQPERASIDDALSELLDATNSFHMDDEFASKFKEPTVEYPKFTPTNLIRKMASIERNSSTFAQEVRFLIKCHLHSTSNSRFNVTSKGYDEYQKLMKKYRVDRKVQGDNITLQRIAASFPIVSVDLLRRDKIDRKFSTAMLKLRNAEEFPWCMRTQMCLSLAPTSAQYINDPDHHNIIAGIVAYMYFENKVVNGSEKVVLSAVFEKVLNIAHSVYKGSSVNEEKKKHAWNHVAYDYTLHKESVNALLKHFRAEIPDAEAVIKHRFGFTGQNNFKKDNKPKGENPQQFSRRFAN